MVSLIVATLNRTSELERLLASLGQQSYKDLEVIVVDQNSDDRLTPILARHPDLVIHRLQSGRGLSRGRNVALPHAKGDIIGFPDDDCWYPPRLLGSVAQAFGSDQEIAALFAALRDENNRTVGPKWPQHARFWTKEDVWTNAISPAGFVRRETAARIGYFDERIGIGASTPYQSGEDVDYFVRPLQLGMKIWYDPALTVHHPSFHRLDRILERAYSYSLGGGYTLRIHRYPLWRLLYVLMRSIGGALVSLARFDRQNARAYLLRAAGLLRGYILGPYDVGKAQPEAEDCASARETAQTKLRP